MPLLETPDLYYTAGPVSFGPITFSSTNSGNDTDDPSVFGSAVGYGYVDNGTDSGGGVPLAGLNSRLGSMTFSLSFPVSALIAEIRWAVSAESESSGLPITAQVFNDADELLESITFSPNGIDNAFTLGDWGFERSLAEISKLTLSNGYITAREFRYSVGVQAIPEPRSIALATLGFFILIGLSDKRLGLSKKRRVIEGFEKIPCIAPPCSKALGVVAAKTSIGAIGSLR